MQKYQKAVLDSYSLLAYLYMEKGYDIILDLFEQAIEQQIKHLISSVNWAEVSYIVERKSGKKRWADVKKQILDLPIEIISVDQNLAEIAATFKAKGGISLADCFAAALAKQKNLTLFTGDPEFYILKSEISICYI
jgi:ribonuclease VapC